VDKRFHTLAGSAVAVDYSDGYDVVLLVNFLHHFDPATVEEVLRKVHQALRGSGRAAILEFIPNGRSMPPIAVCCRTWPAR
jgi:SAM-dependent methyltransferase